MRFPCISEAAARRAVTLTFVVTSCLAAPGIAPRESAAAPVWDVHLHAGDIRDLAVDGNIIWCATSGGALRFDPTTRTFEQWIREPGKLGSNFLSSVALDPSGVRWFGSDDAGVSGLLPDNRTWISVKTRDGLPSSKVNLLAFAGPRLLVGTDRGYSVFDGGLVEDICFDDPSSVCPLRGGSLDIKDLLSRGDTLWVATSVGLYRRVGSTWTTRNEGLGADLRIASLLLHGAEVWLVAGRGETYRGDGNGPFRLDRTGIPSPIDVLALREIDGAMYALTRQGVYLWNGASFDPLGALEFEVRDLVRAGGPLWAATSDGLWAYDDRVVGPTAWVYQSPPGPAVPAYFQAIDVDAAGSVWVGTRQGIVKYDGTAWSVYTPREKGLQDNWILSVHADREGRIWFGHCCCFGPPACRLDLLPDADAGAFGNLPLYDDRVITEDTGGRIWVGSETMGLSVFDPHDSSTVRFTNQTTGGELNSDIVRGIVFAPPGQVTIAHLNSGLNRLDTHGTIADLGDDTWSSIRAGTGSRALRDENVISLAAGPDGVVYAATGAGLEIVSPTGNTSIIRQNNGLNDAAATAVAVAPDGTVWVGSAKGVNVVRNGQVEESFTTENSPIADNMVVQIAIDGRDGSAWIASDHGVSHVRLDGGGTQAKAKRYLYPNPWRSDLRSGGLQSPAVRIGNTASDATAKVFTLTGEEIASFAPTSGSLVWDGRGRSGTTVAAGIYLVVVHDRGEEEVLRLAVLH